MFAVRRPARLRREAEAQGGLPLQSNKCNDLKNHRIFIFSNN